MVGATVGSFVDAGLVAAGLPDASGLLDSTGSADASGLLDSAGSADASGLLDSAGSADASGLLDSAGSADIPGFPIFPGTGEAVNVAKLTLCCGLLVVLSPRLSLLFFFLITLRLHFNFLTDVYANILALPFFLAFTIPFLLTEAIFLAEDFHLTLPL